MKLDTRWIAVAAVLLPAAASAQTISGAAEWTVSRGTSATDGQPQDNNAFWQGYTLGLSSALVSPKFLKYDTEVSFRTNSLTFGARDNSQQGTQRDLGYRLGGILFPAGHFSAYVSAVRDNIAESGDYPSSSGIRGGIVVPPDVPSPDFRTRNSSLSGGMHLDFKSLPRVDIGYRQGASVVTGGPYRAEQRDADLHVGVYKDTGATRHALRYQHTAFDNPVSQLYNQRFDDLDYEFGATLRTHGRATARVGRRRTFTLFEVPESIVDPGTGDYHPPTRGASDTAYVISTVSYEPSARVGFDATASFDRQTSGGATTDARLASGSARLEVFRGFTVNASGIYGDRGQLVGDVPVRVLTRSGLAGGTYRLGVRWFEGSVAYSAGLGANTTPEGLAGQTKVWNGQANLAFSAKWLGLNGSYQRSRSRDDILDYGNYYIERTTASAQSLARRLSLRGSWEQSRIERGRGLTFAANIQRTFSGSLSVRVWRDTQLSANAGGFTNHGDFGSDHTIFAGAAVESQLGKGLHLSAWIRKGSTAATLTNLDQRTLYAFGQIEYRLRQFNLAVEYRHNDQDLRSGDLPLPVAFRGHQFMVRISRKFGFHV